MDRDDARGELSARKTSPIHLQATACNLTHSRIKAKIKDDFLSVIYPIKKIPMWFVVIVVYLKAWFANPRVRFVIFVVVVDVA